MGLVAMSELDGTPGVSAEEAMAEVAVDNVGEAGFGSLVVDGVDMAVETTPCQGRTSTLYEATLVRDIDKYLRLSDMRVFLVCKGAGDGMRTVDATRHMGARHSLIDAIRFMDDEMPDAEMFLMFGALNGALDMAVTHARGTQVVSIVTPSAVPADVRRSIARTVSRGIEMARLF